MARSNDVFANIASARVTESAANTLTFAEIVTGISLGQGIGMIIDGWEWKATRATLITARAADAQGDGFDVALCTQNTVADLTTFNDRRILLKDEQVTLLDGAAATAMDIKLGSRATYTPPLIIAAPRLFFAVKGTGMASALVVDFRLYFRYIDLQIQEYLELAEAFTLTG